MCFPLLNSSALFVNDIPFALHCSSGINTSPILSIELTIDIFETACPFINIKKKGASAPSLDVSPLIHEIPEAGPF